MRKIDQLKELLESQVDEPEDWPKHTTELLSDDSGLTLNVPEEQVSFCFDTTGEKFLGIVNYKIN